MKPVIVFGISNFAKMLYIISKSINNVQVEAFLVDDEYYTDNEFCGLPVWRFSDLNHNMIETYDFLICVGYKKMRSRKIIFDKLSEKGCNFINFIHPSVTILPEVNIGKNNILLANVTIENNVNIGDNNVFWSQSLIAHDSIVCNHNFFAPRTVIAGHCVIGNLCFFGVNSFIVDNIKVSDETYLIAGSGLFKNTELYTRYGGNPARKIDSHEKTGICI